MHSAGGPRSATILVGREVELDALRRVVRIAAAGEPSCTLLIGEGGVGKSRLLAEVTAAARQARLGVAAGRAPISAPAPFSIIAEALRSWSRGHHLEPVGTPFDQGVRFVLPEWQAPGGDEPQPLAPQLAADQLRLLALEGIVRVLQQIAAAGPGALLVLDDLHAADPESLEALRYVASAAVGGLAIVGALRPDESVLASELVRALRGQQAATAIELEPLPRRAVRDLVANLIGAAPPAELVSDVVARTDGVPLFVEEVVEAHMRAGSVLVDAGTATWRGGAAGVPRSVREMVKARLERLPGPLANALVAAAVAGPPDPPGLIAAVAATDDQTVADALRRGVDVGLLATSAGVIGFRHDIVREAVLDSAVPIVVSAMHRRAASHLHGHPDQGRRAEHLAAAGELDEAAMAFAAAAAAGLGGHALLGAERLARRAVELARAPAVAAAAADALAAVLSAQGRWAEALETDEATAAEHGDTHDRLIRMASAALEAGYPDRATALLRRADQRLPLTPLLAGRAALVAGDATTALAEADAVLADKADTETRLTALDLRARALDFADQRAAAREAWVTQAAEAGAAGRTQARLRALFQLGKQEFFLGMGPGRLAEAAQVAAEAGALVELAWVEETLAIALTLHGDPGAALGVLDGAITRARQLRLDQLGFLLVAKAGALALVEPEPAPEALLAEAESLAPAPDLLLFTAMIRADITIRYGRYEEAVTAFVSASDMHAAMPGAAPIDSSCYLVWALAAVGRADEARAALRSAEAMPDLARWYPRPVLIEAGRALLSGDAAGVDAAIAAAPGPMPFDVALMRTIGARVLGGDIRVAWLREALDIYEATGATAFRERARALLRDAGGPVPRRRAAPAVPAALAARGVTAREAEVLRLLGDGMSNSDIAAKLFLSVRTVETHVSSLLAKLQARSRGQLTAMSAGQTWVP